jgi:DNA-binding NtrC family response regulator
MAHERKMKITPPMVAKANPEYRVDGRKRILVFSPDRDLAESLSLLLEGYFEIVRVTSIQSLQGMISSTHPALLLIDLFSFPSDILKVLDIIGSSRKTIPIIILHVYQQRNPTMEDAIQKAADLVLFKPVDVDEIGSSITRLLKDRAG